MSLDFYSIKTPSCFFIAVFACYSVCINQKFWFRIDYDCCAEDKRKQCVFVCSLPTLADPSQLFWHSDDLSEILKYIMIKCKLSFPQSFSTVLTTRHVKEGMIKRKDNVTTWSWRWFFSYWCWKCFVLYLCGICGHDDVMMVMMLVLMVLSLLVWNMWTDSVAVRHQWQTALHQTVIFIFISFNLFIYLSLYLYLYLN